MTKSEYVAKLKEGVEAWNAWRLENSDYLHLDGVDISGTILADANLTLINLSGADLSDTDLKGAELMFSNLTGADLSNADLTHAQLGWTYFVDIDLSATKGLDLCQHHGPSSVGIDTFFKSNGVIPAVFLRGCGVPEQFITQTRCLAGHAIDFCSCFISYNHIDKPFAQLLYDTLQNRGVRCWLDEKQLLPGDDIYDRVEEGIRHWDKILLCCSKSSLTSWWVDHEIGGAFAKEQEITKKRKKKVLALIPLDLDGYLWSEEWKNGKASQIRERLVGDFQEWQNRSKFEEQIAKVLRALRTDDGAREHPPTPKL